jgi:hypothetical protein
MVVDERGRAGADREAAREVEQFDDDVEVEVEVEVEVVEQEEEVVEVVEAAAERLRLESVK